MKYLKQERTINFYAIEKASILLLIGSLTFLWFNIIPLRYTVALTFIFISTICLIITKWIRIRQTGFLNNISQKFKVILLERSLFDILCDVWYFEALKRHIRVFLMPFFIKKSPEEIIESFEEINPKIKEAILRKGTINLLPKVVKEELATNYVEEGNLNEVKQLHKQNMEEIVKANHWDRVHDYEQYQQQKKKNNSQTLLHVMTLLMHKPIVNKENHKINLKILSKKTKSLLIVTVLIIVMQMYFQKSSRRIYEKAFTFISSMSLLALASTSFGLMVLSNKKQKLI